MLPASVQQEIKVEADKRSIPPHNVMGCTEVESAGVVFWQVNGKNVPPARPEGHYFYARLKGAELQKAVSLGLAHPRAGGVRVPASWAGVYDMIDRMKAINETAALESCSWGLGQVMGANWQSLGYSSVQEMVDRNMSGSAGQIECMMRFIDRNGLVDELQRGDFAGFARVYNGPGYRANNYDNLMAAAAARYKRLLDAPAQVAAVASEQVREIQKKLTALGYFTGEINGIEEQRLRNAICALQRDNGLAVDGQYGLFTSKAVDEAIAKKQVKSGNQKIGVGVGGAVATSIGNQVVEQSKGLMGLGEIPYLKEIVFAMTVIGTALVLWGLYQKLKAGES